MVEMNIPAELICRLCFATEGTMEPLFVNDKSALWHKIFECTAIKIINIKGIPSSVCEVCKSKLIICYQFVEQCNKTDGLIKSIYEEQISRHNENVQQEQVLVPKNEVVEQEEDSESFSIMEMEEASSDPEPETIPAKPDKDVGSTQDQVIFIEIKVDESSKKKTKKRLPRKAKQSPLKTPSSKEKDISLDDESDEMDMKDLASEPVLIKHKGNKDETLKTYKIVDGEKVRYKTECQVCGTMQQNIKQHMWTHTGERKHQCPYCAKEFAQRGNYNHHLNIHTGNKPYRCEDCGKGFCDPNSLKSHRITHTKERNYRCEICGKDFGHSHTLAAHRRIHYQDKKHKCSYCGKLFLTNHGLKKHVRIHTGEKPYQCDVCSKGFTSSGNLSTHMRVHTKERPYKCGVCNMDFGYRSVLNCHMRTHSSQAVNSVKDEKDLK